MNIEMTTNAAIGVGVGFIGAIAIGMSRMYWRGHMKGYEKAIDDVCEEYDKMVDEMTKEFEDYEKTKKANSVEPIVDETKALS